MALRYDQVADLIKIVDASACDELVLETAELKLVVRRKGYVKEQQGGSSNGAGQAPAASLPDPAARAGVARLPGDAPAASPRLGASETVVQTAGLVDVRAPMVGTFYRAATPDAAPFVEIGSTVAAGDPLCLIEVMKLFTTLYAETSGRIVEIAASDGELVEYGRALFVIEPG